MSRVTTKLQVTLPKAIATRYNIRPGDEIDFVAAGDVVRIERRANVSLETSTRLDLFDAATARQQERPSGAKNESGTREWTREELYDRGLPR